MAEAGPKTFNTIAKDGGLDYATVKALCRDQIESGAAGALWHNAAGLSAEASASCLTSQQRLVELDALLQRLSEREIVDVTEISRAWS